MDYKKTFDYSFAQGISAPQKIDNTIAWNGPTSTCKECGATIYYIDSGWISDRGHGGKHWTPKDLCDAHGGRYEEYEYIVPEDQRPKRSSTKLRG